MTKNLPTMQERQETWIQSLGGEDLEEGMTSHSSTLAWEIPWTRRLNRVPESQTQLK